MLAEIALLDPGIPTFLLYLKMREVLPANIQQIDLKEMMRGHLFLADSTTKSPRRINFTLRLDPVETAEQKLAYDETSECGYLYGKMADHSGEKRPDCNVGAENVVLGYQKALWNAHMNLPLSGLPEG